MSVVRMTGDEDIFFPLKLIERYVPTIFIR